MSQSLSKVITHIIFSTKKHQTFIADDICDELYKYIAGTLKHLDCIPIIIDGSIDHIHILCSVSKNLSLSETIRKIKTSSSKWIKTKDNKLEDFSWQKGYAAFSVSQSAIEDVKRYIYDQKQHHKKLSFKEELIKFLEKHKIDYNPEYIWD